MSRGDSEPVAVPNTWFRELVERLPAVIYECSVTAPDAWYYVSPQLEDLLGYTPAEWIADPGLWEARLHPEDRAGVLEIESREEEIARSGDVTAVSEYRILHRDGHAVWVRDEARITDGDSDSPRWRGVLIDITSQRKAERALAEAHQSYRRFIESLPVCLYRRTADADALWTFVSPQIEQLVGYTAEEWRADPALWPARLHDHDRARVLADRRMRTRLTSGAGWDDEYRMVHRSGDVVWVRDRGIVVDDPSAGRELEGILTDVTSQRAVGEHAGHSPDVLRLACQVCGSVWPAARVEPCMECGSDKVEAVSLNATLHDLALARRQVEGLLHGIHEHLEALGTDLGGAALGRPRTRAEGAERRVLTRLPGDPDA